MGRVEVADLREDYRRGSLERSDLAGDPLRQFATWLSEALADGLPEPNAMVVATVDERGAPDARVVLLKDYDERGLVFYTNYSSAKGQQIERSPRAALVFNWLRHERQVRIRGSVSRVSREETEAYFHSRPLASQIGAWSSNQSTVIAGRDELDGKRRQLEEHHATTGRIPVPPHWGGYRVAWEEAEFWQGRSSRLHDRFRFSRPGDDEEWVVDRLAP